MNTNYTLTNFDGTVIAAGTAEEIGKAYLLIDGGTLGVEPVHAYGEHFYWQGFRIARNGRKGAYCATILTSNAPTEEDAMSALYRYGFNRIGRESRGVGRQVRLAAA